MRALMISTDKKILDQQSAVAKRMQKHGAWFSSLDIIVLSDGERVITKIDEKTKAYGTGSKSKWLSIWDAIKIGKSLGTYDYILTQDPFETGFIGNVIRKKETHFHVQIHTDVMSPYFVKSHALNRMRRMLVRYILPKANSVRVVSDRIKKSITNIVNAPIVVLPIVTNINRSENTKPLNFSEHIKKWVVMVGRLEEEKNYKRAMEAFAKVAKRHSHVGLLIIGSGSLKEKLHEHSEKIGSKKNIFFAGYQADVSHFLNNADIYLHTSLYEGYGLSILEAAYHDVAIVTTDVGLIGEELICGKNVICIPQKQISAIADGLEKAITNDQLCKKMRHNVKDVLLKRSYSWSEYEHGYKDVLGLVK